MDILAHSLQTRQPITVHVDDPVELVEQFLDRHKICCVPVLDSLKNCFGIITIKDILRLHASNPEHKGTKAWEICSHRFLQIEQHCTVSEAAKLIIGAGVHHLLIMDGKVVTGVLSSLDLLKHFHRENRNLEEQIAVKKPSTNGPETH